MKNIFFVLLLFLLVSCNSTSQKDDKSEEKEELIMYVPSELTMLMEEIYVTNELIKSQIVKGEVPTQFPNNFLKIHTAKMTDRFERDTVFDILANNFIKSQQSIYKSTPKTVKGNFNNTINACVACHQNTCTGPIPRIKKLLIK
ncbi:MAG: hypothetical protein L3J14_05960 [Flavobacteriaceae bacterium]|nr:hypothetical protein [Flavobacteriaceae bacterium]